MKQTSHALLMVFMQIPGPLLKPIIILYLLNKGLELSDALLLQGVSFFSAIILTIPGGLIAQRLGLKKAILFSIILFLLCSVLYINGTSLFDFLLANIIFASAVVLIDSLGLQKLAEDIDLIGVKEAWGMKILAVGSVIGGFLYVLNPVLPFYCTIFLWIITGTIVLKTQWETKVSIQVEKISFTFKNFNSVIAPIVIAAIILGVVRSIIPALQPLAVERGMSPAMYGLVFAALMLIAGFSVNHFRRFSLLRLELMGMVLILSLVLMVFLPSYWPIYLGCIPLAIDSLARFNAIREVREKDFGVGGYSGYLVVLRAVSAIIIFAIAALIDKIEFSTSLIIIASLLGGLLAILRFRSEK